MTPKVSSTGCVSRVSGAVPDPGGGATGFSILRKLDANSVSVLLQPGHLYTRSVDPAIAFTKDW